ncbi:MAG TPA: nucleoside triphosphate pyrophosphohydrolase, partial [Hyphomicrobiales bacterium]|nr:nucleoside triphosphate pyrophosphohydrolase [Hyphomicrobiales bacterium]
MAVLRNKEHGCPWDVEQDFASIAPYTIEEAYEVADAIARGDLHDLKDELGDLLLQVVYHAQMAEEAGEFGFSGVADAVTRKMIRRHPHVFGDEQAKAAGAVRGMWDRIKAEEAAAKAAAKGDTPAKESALDGVPLNLPALTRSVKIQKRAAKTGFDWGEVPPILDKLKEELSELEEEISEGNQTRI